MSNACIPILVGVASGLKLLKILYHFAKIPFSFSFIQLKQYCCLPINRICSYLRKTSGGKHYKNRETSKTIGYKKHKSEA